MTQEWEVEEKVWPNFASKMYILWTLSLIFKYSVFILDKKCQVQPDALLRGYKEGLERHIFS